MYNAGIPETLVADKSGHRSMKSLCSYERTSKGQETQAGRSIQQGKEYAVAVVNKENFVPDSVPHLERCATSTYGCGPYNLKT